MDEKTKVHDISGAIQQVADYKRGKLKLPAYGFSDEVDVKSIRESCKMTQQEFSANFGVSLATLQNWEQGRRQPEGPAKLLLKLIMAKPEVVKEAIASFQKGSG